MKNRLITHSITFLLGILLSYLLFRTEATLHEEIINLPSNDNFIDDKKTTEQTKDSHIDDYRQVVINKDKQIAALKSQLLQLRSKSQKVHEVSDESRLAEHIAENNNDSPSLKKMNFEDFEDTVKNSFNNRFKGVILELSGKKLDDIKRSFQQSSHTNEWSAQYESSISTFLLENDLNGDHFVNSLSCNSSVCRLEVNTNNTDSWNTLYASMTEQEWYESITIQETSDYPGNIIYYLPSFKN